MPKLGNVDAEKFISGLHDYIERALKPIGKRLDDLEEEVTEPQTVEARLADLERRVDELEEGQ